jgi:hypothetical protein
LKKKKTNQANNSRRERMKINTRTSLAVIPLMLPVQKYHNQTNTPPTETQQALLENFRCVPTPG